MRGRLGVITTTPTMKKRRFETKTLYEHVLTRPSTYVGDVRGKNRQGEDVVSRDLEVVPYEGEGQWSDAYVKIFQEILVNALDHTEDGKRIDVSFRNDSVEVKSQSHIPVERAGEGNVTIPELIFGTLLTSSNYDDTEDRVVAGQNGIGAKATNIFSKAFDVVVDDAESALRVKVGWESNMSVKRQCKITKFGGKVSSVCVSYVPDGERLGTSFEHALPILRKCVVDAAATSAARLFLREEGDEKAREIKIKDMSAYARLFGVDCAHACTPNWDVAVGESKGNCFCHDSFANGCHTPMGGTHVDHVATALCDALARMRGVPTGITKAFLRSKMHLFVSVKGVINPTFSNQMKDTLTSRMDVRFVPSEAMVRKLFIFLKPALEDQLKKQEQKVAKRDDGRKVSRVSVANLDDALWAGTGKSDQCTLIVTEGLSAKTLAISGLAVVGRERFGVYPLKGKPLNVRNAKAGVENVEFSALKKILGLKAGAQYEGVGSLRYGRVLILADQDVDGKHLACLVINMIHHGWPSLVRLGFCQQMVTPIIKVKSERFFSVGAFRAWSEGRNVSPRDVKYYKGLGTSTAAEAREYFKEIGRLTIIFKEEGAGDREAMELAFEKSNADRRKEWIMAAPASIAGIPYGDAKSCTLSEFVHKELLQFSLVDVRRSLPALEDGLKPSQRKILYACFLRNLKDDVKVAQLSGYVAEKSSYHHGEASLQNAIIGLAQDYAGSNNVNLLVPSGQFGSRLHAGGDHASARYIFTRLHPVARALFHPADDCLLPREEDDGTVIEPVAYVPVLPVILINGCSGIGTGFSTFVPPHCPREVCDAVRRWVAGEAHVPLTPWWRGVGGAVAKGEREGSWIAHGSHYVNADGTISVQDLPAGTATAAFVEDLEKMVTRGTIQDFVNRSTDVQVDIVVRGYRGGDAARDLKLTRTISTRNMHLIADGTVRLFESTEDILNEFCERRLALYARRRERLLEDADADIGEKRVYLEWVRRAVGDLDILRRPLDQVREELDPAIFPPAMHSALFRLPLTEFNAHRIGQREIALAALVREREILAGRTARDLWREDLDNVVHYL